MATEVNIEEIIYRIARERGWSPEDIDRFEYIVSHLERGRILRRLVERWYGDQLRYFPERAYENTLRRLADAYERIVSELREAGIDIEAVDLAIAFESVVDYGREDIDSFVNDVLSQMVALASHRLADQAEQVATQLEQYVVRLVHDLKAELSKLRELDPEAYRRVLKELLDIAERDPRIAELEEALEKERREREKLERRLRELSRELEKLRTEASEARENIVRETRRAREARPRERIEERIGAPGIRYQRCPGGEDPLPLDVVWGLIHREEPYLERFRLWLRFNWDTLSYDFKKLVLGYTERRPPPLAARSPTEKALWNELYSRFIEAFRERFPRLYEALEHLSSPPTTLKFYALCPQHWLIYRLNIRGTMAWLGRAVKEDSVLRDLAPYLEAAVAPRTLELVYPPGRRRPFRPTLIQWMATPHHAYRAVGGRCPVCGSPKLVCHTTDHGQVAFCTCQNCLVSVLYNPITDERVLRVPANWERLPNFNPAWLDRLRELEQEGWRIEFSSIR